jgi:hypothetical protein
MRHRKGLLHKVDLVVLTLLCIIFCFLIPFVLSFGFNIPIPGMYTRMLASRSIASINLGW